MYSIQEQGPQGRQAAMPALRSITNEERESQVPVLRPNVAIVEPNSDSIEEQDVQVAVQETQPSRGNQPRPRNSDSIEEQGSQAAVQESRPKRKPKLRGRARAKNRRAKKRKAKSKTKQNRARKARAMKDRAMKDRAGALVNMTRTLRVRVWFMRLGSDWIVFLII